jgi:hypothetical protein
MNINKSPSPKYNEINWLFERVLASKNHSAERKDELARCSDCAGLQLSFILGLPKDSRFDAFSSKTGVVRSKIQNCFSGTYIFP